jgi:hypothetical protein
VDISTTPSYFSGAQGHGVTLNFIRWNSSGNVTIDNSSYTSTKVRNITGNGNVTALYAPDTVTIPPTATPTWTPTPTKGNNTPTPTPSPTPTTKKYTFSVTYVGSDGSSRTDTYTNLSSTSVVSVSAPSSITFGVPPNGQTITFVQWYVSGSCTVGNTVSSYTSVTNFSSNASMSASYR